MFTRHLVSREPFRAIKGLLIGYLGIGIAALVVVILLRNHPAEVADEQALDGPERFPADQMTGEHLSSSWFRPGVSRTVPVFRAQPPATSDDAAALAARSGRPPSSHRWLPAVTYRVTRVTVSQQVSDGR